MPFSRVYPIKTPSYKPVKGFPKLKALSGRGMRRQARIKASYIALNPTTATNIMNMRGRGLSAGAIGKKTGMDERTVNQFLYHERLRGRKP